MNYTLRLILKQHRLNRITTDFAEQQILSLMGENSKRVSDLPASHGDLHCVRKSECEADVTSEGNSKDVGGTLGNRIEKRKSCTFCGNTSYTKTLNRKIICQLCSKPWQD